MTAPAGSLLFEAPPHQVNIFLPLPPSFDSGGGVKNNWVTDPSQEDCPCIINTTGASQVMRQGQNSVTVGNVISIHTLALTVVLVQGAKLIAPDTGRTFIIRGLRYPDRPFGHYVTDMPALTYVDCDEIL